MILLFAFLRTYELKKLLLVSFFAFSIFLGMSFTAGEYIGLLDDISDEEALLEMYGDSSLDLLITAQSIDRVSTELPDLKKLETMIVGGGNLTIITSNGTMVNVLPIFSSDVSDGFVFLSKAIWKLYDIKGAINLLLNNDTLEYHVKGVKDIDSFLEVYRFTAWGEHFYSNEGILAIIFPFSFIADHDPKLTGEPIKFLIYAYTDMPPILSQNSLINQLKVRVDQWKVKILEILDPSDFSTDSPLLRFLAFDDYYSGTGLFLSFLRFVFPLVILIVSAYVFLDNVEERNRISVFGKIERRGGYLSRWQQKLLQISIVPAFLAIFSLIWYFIVWLFFMDSFYYFGSILVSALVWIIALFLIVDLRPKLGERPSSKAKRRTLNSRTGIVVCSATLLLPQIYPLSSTLTLILLLICLLFLINHLIRKPPMKKGHLSFDLKRLHYASRVAIVFLVLINIGFVFDATQWVHTTETIPNDLWMTFGLDGDVYMNVDSIRTLESNPDIVRTLPALNSRGYLDGRFTSFYQFSKDSLYHLLADFPAPIFYQSKSKLLERLNSAEKGILLTAGLANSQGLSIGDSVSLSIETEGKVKIYKTIVLGIIGIARIGYPPSSSDYAIFFDVNGANASNMFGIDLSRIPTKQELLDLIHAIEIELNHEFAPGRVQLGHRLSNLPEHEKWRNGDLLAQFERQRSLVLISTSLILTFMLLVIVFPSILFGIPNWERIIKLTTVLKRRGEISGDIERRIAKDVNGQIYAIWLEKLEGLVVAFSTWLFAKYFGIYPYRMTQEIIYLGGIVFMAIIANITIFLWIKRKIRRLSYD